MFRFENISGFAWIWLIPVFLIVTWLFSQRHSRKVQSVIGARLYPFLASSVSNKKRQIKLFLQCLVIFIFIVSMARPQMGESKQEIKTEGVEIIFAVDVSESMNSDDVKPSRLEQAKAELSKLIDLMPGNKVGVIAFAGNAVLQTPLTNDPAAIKMYLESLSVNSVSTQGTNFQSAIELAKEAFERGGATADDTTKVTRVVLFASDGEDHEPGALDAAKKYLKEGIRVFALAYGTEKGGAIPVRDGMGYLKGYKKDRSGQTILTQVNGKALRELSDHGQGSFYFASFGGDHIKNIVDDLNTLEKTQFESSVATQYEERYQIILLLGILLALLELFLGERRSAFRLWKGRYEVPPA